MLLTIELLSIMGMIVGRLFMLRMFMIVGPVVFRMIVLVIACLPLMAVAMAVPMFVLMFVFVIAFHFKSSFLHVVLSIHLVSSIHPSPFYHYNWFGVFSLYCYDKLIRVCYDKLIHYKILKNF